MLSLRRLRFLLLLSSPDPVGVCTLDVDPGVPGVPGVAGVVGICEETNGAPLYFINSLKINRVKHL